MPKISVYLSDELYAAAREKGLSISALAQEAVLGALRAAATDRWVADQRARAPRVHTELDTAGALHDAREEFGA